MVELVFSLSVGKDCSKDWKTPMEKWSDTYKFIRLDTFGVTLYEWYLVVFQVLKEANKSFIDYFIRFL